jgi:GH24 family phage-related lysozyme (muramidase)
MHANLGLDKLGPLTNDDIQAVATPVLNPDGANPTAKNIALSALKENKAPAVALTLATEGLSLKVMRDPNKKHDTIGAGYNLSTREKKQILSDLQRAGVAPGDVESVLERGMEITPAQAIKLTQIVLDRESRPAAKAAFNARFGEGAFGNLPPNYQAALVYLAYNVGPGGIAKFPKAMEAIQQGNLAAAMAETKTYNNGQLLSRAHTLMKGMLKGESHFEELLNRGI